MSSDLTFGFSRALNGAQIAARLTGNALVLRDSDLTIVGNADATKVLAFTLAGNTTGKTLTLAPQQTTNQQLNFPNITGTDTLSALNMAQTFLQNQTWDLNTAGGALPSSPGAAQFRFAGPAATNTRIEFNGWSAGNIFQGMSAGGSRGTPSGTPDTFPFMSFRAFGHNGTSYTSGAAANYNLAADGIWSGINNGTYHQWIGTPNGSTISTEWMRLTSACLYIGTDPGGSDRVRIGGALTISDTKLLTSKTTLTDFSAAAAGTLTNAPTAGNPTKWISINDNGTLRKIPTWT